jgi:hypothetical protein
MAVQMRRSVGTLLSRQEKSAGAESRRERASAPNAPATVRHVGDLLPALRVARVSSTDALRTAWPGAVVTTM